MFQNKPPEAASEDPQVAKLKREVEYLQLQTEKLALELDELKGTSKAERTFRRFIPIVTALLGVAGFWFGVYQYVKAEAAALHQRGMAEKATLVQRALEERQLKDARERSALEAKRTSTGALWQRQIALYMDAAEAASKVATTEDDAERKGAEAKFWMLYWGPMAMLEDISMNEKPRSSDIEAAMVQFGRQLQSPHSERDRAATQQASLRLAHAFRTAIEDAFDVAGAPANPRDSSAP